MVKTNAPDGVTAGGVRKHLGDLSERISVEVLPECASTNLILKERAAELPAWHTVIARRQAAGRGRLGRGFCSPEGSGLYMSVLLRPELSPEDVPFITTAAAVAVCRAAEELGSAPARIKWVNDVLVGGRKVCGILTEAGSGARPGTLDYAVLGVGINVTEPEGGFPAEIADIAGAMFPTGQPGRTDRLAAAFLRQFYGIYAAFPALDFVAEYRARSCLIGRRVNVLRDGGSRAALALAVDGRCRLLVRYEDGTEEALFSGEVSVRPEAPL